MTERVPNKRKGIVIDLDQNPEFAEVLESLKGKSKGPKDNKEAESSRTNAIAGEHYNPRRSLRRGLQPQE